MAKDRISNALLVIGVAILLAFGLREVSGGVSNPLLPAFSAFFIGCTAVLDRLNAGEFE